MNNPGSQVFCSVFMYVGGEVGRDGDGIVYST